tara:strand:- start:340 stop:666 length:327 start_codon:yes stop_codon:yes gene_type:complete
MNINKLQKDLLKAYCDKGLDTSTSIANTVNMCQSTVYRNLFQPQKKLTRGLVELCNYANLDYKNYQNIDPKSHQYLMDVLTKVWNGTDGHAKQLGRLLLAAHSCKLEQ